MLAFRSGGCRITRRGARRNGSRLPAPPDHRSPPPSFKARHESLPAHITSSHAPPRPTAPPIIRDASGTTARTTYQDEGDFASPRVPCMAATACAYASQGGRPPSLMPATTPARSSPQLVVVLPEPPFDAEPASPVVPPTLPPPQRSFKAPASSLFSHHPGLCTEGLGSESSGDVDLDGVISDVDNGHDEQVLPCKSQQCDTDDEQVKTARRGRRVFPPPISVIGAGGKPWLYLRPHRADGRLVLREVRIPSQELLQAHREDGRFKLHFAPSPTGEGSC